MEATYRVTRSIQKIGVILCIVVLALGTLQSPASAHVVWEKNYWVLQSWVEGGHRVEIRLYVRSEVSHGSRGGGYYKSDVCVNKGLELAPDFTRSCLKTDFEVKQNHWKWDAGRQEWKVCSATAWKERKAKRTKVRIKVNHPSKTPVCGKGYYGTETLVRLEHPDTGKTETYSHWSGYHKLPG